MPRPMQRARFARKGECPVCMARIGRDDEVVVTASGQMCCAAHAAIFVPDSIAWRGRRADALGQAS